MGTFQERLKSLRKEKNLTIEELAKNLGSAKSTISRYENGLREPKKDFLELLCTYFDVSTDYLLGKTDKRNIDTKKEINTNQSKDLEEEIEKVINDKNIQFCGTPLGDEDMKFLRDSLRATLEYAKAIKNKK